MLAIQVIVAPARYLAADNSWHFQLARDVVAGVPIYWSAVDANRLFPDLLFALAACLLPGGLSFATWSLYFDLLVAAADALALVALAQALFTGDSARRTAATATLLGFAGFLLLVPFWDVWLMQPGNHGAGFSVAVGCVAILLRMNASERANPLLAAAFLLLASALVASNRYLLLAFLLPLLAALLLAYAVRLRRRRACRGASPPAVMPDPRRPLLLAGFAGLAAAYGPIAWITLGSLRWHKLVQPGDLVDLPRADLIGWMWQRLVHLLAELEASTHEIWAAMIGGVWGAPIGVAVLVLAVLVALAVMVRSALSTARPTAGEEGRLVFAAFTAAAALASLAFVTVFTPGSGSWIFRFLAMPVGFAVVFLSASATRLAFLRRLRWGRGWPFALASLGLLLASAWSIAASRKGPIVAEERAFAQGIARLENRLRQRASLSPALGFSDYWIANDVTARSGAIALEALESGTGAPRFYNNNAEHLCREGFSFVLVDATRNEPSLEALLAKLGPPLATQDIDLGRYPKVKVLYYDPSLLSGRILAEGRERAGGLFPGFRCRT